MLAHITTVRRYGIHTKDGDKKTRVYVDMGGFPDMSDRAYIERMREALYAAHMNPGALSFSRKAGCGCGCSPGFVAKDSSAKGKDIWVSAYNVSVDRTSVIPVLPVMVYR